MENRLKMRFSRMFRGSFGSCRTGKLSDVVEKSVFVPRTQKDYFHFHMMEPLPPKVRPFPSICRPNCPENTTNAITNSIFPRQKISGRYPPFISASGHTCPPASPASPFNPFYKEFGLNQRKKKSSSSSKNKKKNKCNNRRDLSLFSSSSQDSAYFDGSYWFTSEEEEDEGESDTLFSSRSHSTDSSGSHIRHRSLLGKKYSISRRRSRTTSKSSQMGVLPLHGKVKDSFAVVKSSNDPYNDFRTSMVEMIVEKQIFSAKDLEQLLQCFLSLNSDHHHRIILEVFTEIWEALFSNWS